MCAAPPNLSNASESAGSARGDVPATRARIYGMIARTARRAIIFRRGPSRQVRLLAWDLRSDALDAGQWFRGRIYERRCDLTPNGDMLVYFAASYRKPFYSWTAISRPPYLSALALWPKGDCWGGGGLFASAGRLYLNHGPNEFQSAPGFVLPANLKIEPMAEQSGRGEDSPIMFARALREGWVVSRDASHDRYAYAELTKLNRSGQSLRIGLDGIGIRTAELAASTGRRLIEFERIDWIDFDHNGDVLFARDGCLFRIRGRQSSGGRLSEPRLIADLNDMTFEPVAAPAWATRQHP